MDAIEQSCEPVLVIDAITRSETHPNRMSALLRLRGQPLQVVLDFSRRDVGFTEHVIIPPILGAEPLLQRAVVNVLDAAFFGRPVVCPLDLSESLRDPPHDSPSQQVLPN